jgi:Cupin domain
MTFPRCRRTETKPVARLPDTNGQRRRPPSAPPGGSSSFQWEVEAEIAERYYARVAKEPTEHPFTAGDTIYVPTNTVHRYVNEGDEPLTLLVGQNRIFKHIGYDNVVVLEPASDLGAVASTSTR